MIKCEIKHIIKQEIKRKIKFTINCMIRCEIKCIIKLEIKRDIQFTINCMIRCKIRREMLCTIDYGIKRFRSYYLDNQARLISHPIVHPIFRWCRLILRSIYRLIAHLIAALFYLNLGAVTNLPAPAAHFGVSKYRYFVIFFISLCDNVVTTRLQRLQPWCCV